MWLSGCRQPLSTMNRLARFLWPFLHNWYDTVGSCPLHPQYITSVDTLENWPGTSSLSPANGCAGNGGGQPLTDERRLAGIADALLTHAQEAGRLRRGRRTQTVTWRQLDDALAVLAANLRLTLVDGDGIAKCLSTLAVDAETLADIALALATERSDGTGADMLFWAEATRSAIESHRRDIEGSAESAVPSVALPSRPWRTTGGGRASGMEFGFLLDPPSLSRSRSAISSPRARRS